MKTIYATLVLLVSFSVYSSTLPIKNTLCDTSKTEVNPQPSARSISGLKIVDCESKKLGKYIFIVSEFYTKKKVSFFNKQGQKVYTTRTVGAPIYLSKLKKGTYYLKIVEKGKVELTQYIIE